MAMHSPVNEGFAIGAADVADTDCLTHKLEELAPHVCLSAVVVVEHELHFQILEHIGVKGVHRGIDIDQCQAKVVHWLLEMLSNAWLQE